MELKIEIKPNQDYEQGSFHFEPDSSPAAYEYYKLIYPSDGYLKQNFNFGNPVFSLSSGRKDGFNYKNAAKTCNNRLFVLLNGTKSRDIKGVKYFETNYKLGGECDFNFNKKKYKLFQKKSIGIWKLLNVTRKMHANTWKTVHKCIIIY